MRATVVVGANFGDEGKGRIVDDLSTSDTVVVRFNGGAQAGHTVVAPDGARHVFSHFGSGTLRQGMTLLSRFFAINPIIFGIEWTELYNLGYPPFVMADPKCPITTPYEVEVNRALERSRGGARHGSCGVGYGETIEREEAGGDYRWERVLSGNRAPRLDGYTEHRLRKLGLEKEVDTVIHTARQTMPTFLDAVEFMRDVTMTRFAPEVIRQSPHIVFEGAQGLLLSEDSKFFPHVTRSRTGVANAQALLKEAEVEEWEAVYVTRTYLTRHGAGPLPGEDPSLAYRDLTNVEGEFQGALRFAPLDVDLMAEAIKKDLPERRKASIALTCWDQFGNSDLLREITKKTGLPISYITNGPQRGAFLGESMSISSNKGLAQVN